MSHTKKILSVERKMYVDDHSDDADDGQSNQPDKVDDHDNHASDGHDEAKRDGHCRQL